MKAPFLPQIRNMAVPSRSVQSGCSTRERLLRKVFSRFHRVTALALLFWTLGDGLHAADKETAPATPDKSAEAEAARLRRVRLRNLAALEDELAGERKLIEIKQHELDDLKVKLGVSEPAASVGIGEAARRLESLRIESQGEYERARSLHSQLTNLTRMELRRSISTAAPDPLLATLLETKSTTEQKLAELGDSFGPEHPEVKRHRRVLDRIEQQIEDRLQGILDGLKTKTAAEKSKVDSLQREMDAIKTQEIASSVKTRPYFQARRELENLIAITERLQRRIAEARAELAVTPQP